MLKRISALVLIFAFLFNIMPIFVKGAEEEKVDLNIKSKAVVLMDSSSGKVLYQKNMNDKLSLASVTKVMTILLILEAIDNKIINMSDMVTISDYASSMGGSQLYLEQGEMRSVEELLNAIIIESANDACAAMGEFIGGSIEKFILMMNEKAKSLGMKNTHFVNSNGLPADNHYSSAYDIALMTKEVCKYPDVFKISSTWQKTIKIGKNNDKERLLNNTNKLLKMNDNVDGLKTGYTADAGHCISATGKKGDLRLIAVILNAPDSNTRFEEANKLLNYGFSNYKGTNIVTKGGEFGEIKINKGYEDNVKVVAKDNFTVLSGKNENEKYTTDIKLDGIVMNAPVKEGQKVGVINIKEGSNVIGSVDLVLCKKVEKINMITYVLNMFKEFISV
ncbi:D-alanyl-D-alanine carboxypeptidase family protein [Anaerofustis sp. NSJ-163]|uniref:D-alanyl-D-alanine carboxypeptidase family protein n=1 Tax=Anaerofustis sp. NSJ-163 TaxID=2944391 RepID=UPI00209C0B6A|nr:D-alanyl-D-alanine carboxypeptidase family protein [Anaerofustis sp. NSJ-163]MCO8193349.1 D-alanyl-D-alanine carboxypeptidase [Anaerofustis sp. NSJ-163]